MASVNLSQAAHHISHICDSCVAEPERSLTTRLDEEAMLGNPLSATAGEELWPGSCALYAMRTQLQMVSFSRCLIEFRQDIVQPPPKIYALEARDSDTHCPWLYLPLERVPQRT